MHRRISRKIQDTLHDWTHQDELLSRLSDPMEDKDQQTVDEILWQRYCQAMLEDKEYWIERDRQLRKTNPRELVMPITPLAVVMALPAVLPLVIILAQVLFIYWMVKMIANAIRRVSRLVKEYRHEADK